MTSHDTRPKPTVLCILDGWGDRTDSDNNAIANAKTPTFTNLRSEWPASQLDASEGFVGLPSGQMGNSEVGHMNIGAGRVVMQDLPKIDAAVAQGSIADLTVFQNFVDAMRSSGGTAHLLGLISPGGVHSHQDHVAAIANLLHENGISVRVHAFLDGRDTPPKSAINFVPDFLSKAPNAAIATVSGRYFAMDRDNRWDRVQRAIDAIRDGKANASPSALSAVQESYDRDITDEFVEPVVIGEYAGMQDGDGLLMLNFRADRAREILHVLIDPAFDAKPQSRRVAFHSIVGMVEYSSELARLMGVLFPAEDLPATMGDVIAQNGLKQLRIAETEKYAHVTFFFNGGREDVFEGEERMLIPSPDVATYDLKPEMSANEVTDQLVDAIQSDQYDFIVVNYANTDMVGHTGSLEAAVKAVETVDGCLARLSDAVLGKGGTMLITADHGNAEQMTDSDTGQPHTAHTMNKVPLVVVGAENVSTVKPGRLADLAPTLLDLMGLDQPEEMTGVSLIDRTNPSQVAAE